MKIFVACSQSNDVPTKYLSDCQILLSKIFKDNHELIFGANGNGLMGLSYQEAKKNNRNIVGICPEAYKKDFDDIECNSEITVKNISERNDKLIEMCDMIIFLPGGIGTIYELFAALECKRGKEFDKPIIIYNCCNYFDSIISAIDKMYDERFASIQVKNLYHVAKTIEEVLDYIKQFSI